MTVTERRQIEPGEVIQGSPLPPTFVPIPTEPDAGVPALIAAVARAAAAVGPVGKDDKMGGTDGYAYRGIDRIMEKARPALTAEGIVIVPNVVARVESSMERGSNRNVWTRTVLTVRWDIYGHGAQIEATTMGEGLDSGDKSVSKSMTMAWKALMLTMLQIAGGHDDGDDERPPEASKPRQASRPAQSSRPPQSSSQRPAKSAQRAAPAAARPDPAEERRKALAALEERFGIDHVAGVRVMLSFMDDLDDVEHRKAVKREFAEQFPGGIQAITPTAFPEMLTWVERHTGVDTSPFEDDDTTGVDEREG